MDYHTLLNLKIKYFIWCFITLFFFLIITMEILNIKYYDTYNCLGLSHDSLLYLNVPINSPDTIINGEYLKIKDELYSYEILSISDLNFDSVNNINYQIYEIKIKETFKENELVNITFYANQEKLWKKIKKIL